MLSKLKGGINAAAYVNVHAIVRLLLIAIMIYQELIMFNLFAFHMVRKIRTLTIRMNPFKVIRQRNVSKCHFSCRKCARLCFTNFSVSGLVSTTSRFRLFCPIPVRFATEVMSET